MKLTCICPVWGRPLRTIRAMECVVNQTLNGWETIFVGDGCPIFQKNIDDGMFDKYKKIAENNGNTLIINNLDRHYGGWGYVARKNGLDIATGEYTIFLDNDDIILNNHFENYYTFMKNKTHIDVGYFNVFMKDDSFVRVSHLAPDRIGHAELIIKTDVLKKEYVLDRKYGHDWKLIDRMIYRGYKFEKSMNTPTYIVKGFPSLREGGID